MSPITAEGETTHEGAWFKVSDMTGCSTDLLHDWLRVARHMVSDLECELSRRTRTAPAAVPVPERLLSAAEAAERLQTTKAHVWAMQRRGKLPIIHVGRKYHRIPLSAIEALMACRPLPAPPAARPPRPRTPRIGRAHTS